MNFTFAGIGAWGRGFQDWPSLHALLSGRSQPENLEFLPPKPAAIPARERRRAPLSVKLAVEVAGQACEMADVAPSETACVFASAMGDMDITEYMCRTVVSNQPAVSPTKFHNSVHNAPVAYWSISSGITLSSNAVAAGHYSASASLMEAINQCSVEGRPVLWVAQDIATPACFRFMFDSDQPCAFALLLLPSEGKEEGSLSASLVAGDGNWPGLSGSLLRPLYEGNPSSRILSCLEKLTGEAPFTFTEAMLMPVNEHLDLRLEAK